MSIMENKLFCSFFSKGVSMLILASHTVCNACSQEEDTPIYFPCWSLLHVSVHYFYQPRFIIQSASICFLTEEEKIIAKLFSLQSGMDSYSLPSGANCTGLCDVSDECCCCSVKVNCSVLERVPGFCAGLPAAHSCGSTERCIRPDSASC